MRRLRAALIVSLVVAFGLYSGWRALDLAPDLASAAHVVLVSFAALLMPVSVGLLVQLYREESRRQKEKDDARQD